MTATRKGSGRYNLKMEIEKQAFREEQGEREVKVSGPLESAREAARGPLVLEGKR